MAFIARWMGEVKKQRRRKQACDSPSLIGDFERRQDLRSLSLSLLGIGIEVNEVIRKWVWWKELRTLKRLAKEKKKKKLLYSQNAYINSCSINSTTQVSYSTQLLMSRQWLTGQQIVVGAVDVVLMIDIFRNTWWEWPAKQLMWARSWCFTTKINQPCFSS